MKYRTTLHSFPCRNLPVRLMFNRQFVSIHLDVCTESMIVNTDELISGSIKDLPIMSPRKKPDLLNFGQLKPKIFAFIWGTRHPAICWA